MTLYQEKNLQEKNFLLIQPLYVEKSLFFTPYQRAVLLLFTVFTYGGQFL